MQGVKQLEKLLFGLKHARVEGIERLVEFGI